MSTKKQRREKEFFDDLQNNWDLLVLGCDEHPELKAKHWEFVRSLAARDFPRQWTEADVDHSTVDECLYVLLAEVPDELKSKWLQEAAEAVAFRQSDLLQRGLHHSQLATPEERAASEKEFLAELTVMINESIHRAGMVLAD